LGVTFVSPDRDHALASPRDVANSAVSQRLGDHLGIDIHDDAQGRYGADLVSYRVNKRFVLRTRGRDQKGNRTFIKALRRQISSESLQFWRRTARRLSAGSSGRVGFPRILAVDVNQRWYAIEGKENGARPFGYDARDGGEAARLLSMIHRLSPCRLKEHSVFDEMEILGRWTKVMRAFGRSDSDAMTSLVAELVNRAGRIDPRPHVLVHRDFYASQLLAEGERTWLLDYDTFAAGDPEVDVATYLAHLVLDRVLAGAAENVMGELPAFLDTYQSMGGLIDPECLRIYLASALARMAAIHGFRRLESSQNATFWAVVWEVVNKSGARMSNASKKKRLAI
jgi:aminoglycoside phosphotransferase (APT) family kinase protein